MKVENYNGVVNQFLIETDKGTYLQSYQSIIVFCRNDGKTFLGRDWDYSVTTGKYRNMFLGETKKETQKKIDNGIYILDLSL